MTAPVRIQRKRSKGWRTPKNTVSVDRTTKYGNPFKVGAGFGGLTAKEAVFYYECWVQQPLRQWGDAACYLYEWHEKTGISSAPSKEHIRSDLQGKNLACWCPLDQPCHADVLLKIAND